MQRTPNDIPHRTQFVTRYPWRRSPAAPKPGYQIKGSNGHWVWLSPQDAWIVAEELAQLLDADSPASDVHNPAASSYTA